MSCLYWLALPFGCESLFFAMTCQDQWDEEKQFQKG